MNRSKDRNEFRIVALLLTLIISAGGVLILVNSFLHYQYPPEDMKDLAALEQDSIMFGGEYVMLGTSPEAVGEEIDTEEPEQPQEVQPKPDVAGDDLADAGEPAKQPKPVVTAKQESPMKVKEKPKEKEKPKKTGPATDEKPAEKQEQVKRGVDAATESKVKNAACEHSRQDCGSQVRGRHRRCLLASQRSPLLRTRNTKVGLLGAEEHHYRGHRNRYMALCGLTITECHVTFNTI